MYFFIYKLKLPWIENGFFVALVTFELQFQTQHLNVYNLYISRTIADIMFKRKSVFRHTKNIEKRTEHRNNWSNSYVHDLFFFFKPLLCPIFHGACHVTSFINKYLNENIMYCYRIILYILFILFSTYFYYYHIIKSFLL